MNFNRYYLQNLFLVNSLCCMPPPCGCDNGPNGPSPTRGELTELAKASSLTSVPTVLTELTKSILYVVCHPPVGATMALTGRPPQGGYLRYRPKSIP